MSQPGWIYAYTTPAYCRTRWKGRRRGRGLVKVGYTRRNPHVRIREQIGASSPEKNPYTLLLAAKAVTRKGQAITDKDVHRKLGEMGVRNVHNEWFEARPEDVRRALKRVKVRSGRPAKAGRGRRGRSGTPRRRSSIRVWLFCATVAGAVYVSHDPDGARELALTAAAGAQTLAETLETFAKTAP